MYIKKEAHQNQKIKDVTKTIWGNCDGIVIDVFNTIEKEGNVTKETNMSYTESLHNRLFMKQFISISSNFQFFCV
jgi:hypothetical protein